MHTPYWPCLLLAAVAAAQEPAHQDLQQLAAAVDRAHRPDGEARQFHAFRADLELKQTAKGQARGEAILHVLYLERQLPQSKRLQSLIRYHVVDAAEQIERGRDTAGYWHLVQGQPRDLETMDTGTDLENAQRDLALARQLLRCLDPGAVLRQLEQPGAVADEPLQLGLGEPIACRTVSGTLPRFPRLTGGGDDGAVLLKAYVAADTSELKAVELFPIVDGKPDREHGELLLLQNLELRDGVKLPRKLLHYTSKGPGKREKQMQIVVDRIELDPELSAGDFDRNKRR